MSSVVTYELEDDGIGIFRIDPYSGIVTLISYIDRETVGNNLFYFTPSLFKIPNRTIDLSK